MPAPASSSAADRLYRLARPALFALDAERAHRIGLQALDLTAGIWRHLMPRVDDPVTLFGVRFANRVGLAAGLDKDGKHIDGLAALGFGFLEIGTVTPKAQPGNARPRLFRLESHRALINRFGFNNDGLAAFVARVRASRHDIPLGLNIGKNAATPIESALDDYLIGLRGVHAHADYVSINVSSPNTTRLRDLQSGAALSALLGGLDGCRRELAEQTGRRVPLLVKIAPDLESAEIEAICAAIVESAIDGVIATNTTLDRAAVADCQHAGETGGLSGAPLRARAERIVAALRETLPAGFPIIGVGGIESADDARRRIEAGADLVQLYTGLIYRGPALIRECAAALEAMPRSS
ncbi:MAG: quinone-dependent dihydroorotate dehydrogenase [Burkholderiaceae bacterium]